LGETKEISVKPRNGSALVLEKPLSIERNDMEYWKYTLNAASEIVFESRRLADRKKKGEDPKSRRSREKEQKTYENDAGEESLSRRVSRMRNGSCWNR
jgi:hypothetical protein